MITLKIITRGRSSGESPHFWIIDGLDGHFVSTLLCFNLGLHYFNLLEYVGLDTTQLFHLYSFLLRCDCARCAVPIAEVNTGGC